MEYRSTGGPVTINNDGNTLVLNGRATARRQSGHPVVLVGSRMSNKVGTARGMMNIPAS
jgi:hypothetical protein